MLRFSCVLLLMLYDAELAKATDWGVIIYNDPELASVIKKYWNNANTIFKSEYDVPDDIFGNGQVYNNSDLEETNKAIQLFAPIYNKRVQRMGLAAFKAIGEYLQKKLFLKKKMVKHVVEKSIQRYNSKLRVYFNFYLRSKSYSDYERHFVLLDMVNFANSQMNSVGKSLVNDLVFVKPGTSITGHLGIIENIFKYSHELVYICKMMHVCRLYPGYSDYFVSILGDVIKLFDIKFIYILTKSHNILNDKKDFFKTILNGDIVSWFTNKTEKIYNADVDKMRIVVSEWRSAITWRQRMLNFTEGAEKDKVKALTILIDIIDRAFDKYDSETLYNQFDEVTSTIRKWGSILSNEVDTALFSFLNNFENTLKSELSKVAKEEMKTLADIVFKGKSDNEFMSRYLMRSGSKFLKGE